MVRILKDRGVAGSYGVGGGEEAGGNPTWNLIINGLFKGYEARQNRKGTESALRAQHTERMTALKLGAGHIPTVFGPYSSNNGASLDLGGLMPVILVGGLGLGAIMILKG